MKKPSRLLEYKPMLKQLMVSASGDSPSEAIARRGSPLAAPMLLLSACICQHAIDRDLYDGCSLLFGTLFLLLRFECYIIFHTFVRLCSLPLIAKWYGWIALPYPEP
jgi:hypothetical protein